MENKPKIGCVVMAAGNARRFGENKLAAQLRGRSLILRALEAVPAEKFDKVVVVTQYPEVMRLAGEFRFAAVHNPHPDYGISHTIALGLTELRDCGGELNRAMRAMVQLLETFPRIDVVMAVNEQAALGAMAALEEKGALSSTLVYSVDGSPEAKALISEGLMTATSAQSPLRIGRMAAEVVYEILEGKPYLTNIVVPVNQITQEDILRYGTEGWQ